MSVHLEVTRADDAQFGFLDSDHDLLVSEPDLLADGEEAFYVTTPDGEGTVITGTLLEIREFVRLMLRGLDLEIEKKAGCPCGEGELGAPGHDGGVA